MILSKKLIAASLIATSISTSLFAAGSHVNLYLGGSNIENNGIQFAAGAGVDLIKPLKYGIEGGVSLSFLYSPQDKFKDTYIVGLDAILGYNFKDEFNVPISTRLSIGYGVGTIDDSRSIGGMEYGISSEYDFSKKIGIGLEYLLRQNYEVDVASGPKPDIKIDNYLAYVYYKF